jgi:outer membrane protein TolC
MGGKTVLDLLFFPAFVVFSLLTSTCLKAQDQPAIFSDSASVSECISYALKHQPMVTQLKIDEEIAERDIKISFADWYPQITSSAGLQHYLQQPVSIFPNFSDPAGPKIEVTTGVANNSNLQFNATQKIFNNDLIFAGKTAKYYRQQAGQSTQKAKIQLVVEIRKAFYDVLLTQQMLNIIDDEIDRLTRSLNDALAMYNNGIRDKIDYTRATMLLNTARSQKIAITNSIITKVTYLKQLMGYPEDSLLSLRSSFNEMRNDIMIDTLQDIQYRNRIEFQLLQTDLSLEKLSIGYYRQSFLPSLAGFVNYNINYQNDNFGQLYNKTFPNSLAGLSLSFPLFEGTRRIQNIKKSKLLYDRLVLDTINLRHEMHTGYIAALSSYKSNFAAYRLTKQNIELARNVYNAVQNQYKEGIKPYLEVIVSETDLRNAELNNLTSVIMLMFSKIDLEQALGKISIDY